VPDHDVPEINIDVMKLSSEQALREIVKNNYDIRLDDRLLRQLVSASGNGTR